MKKVCILLATYNGVQYLEEQLESIRKQTYRNWELFIRDDGSDDDTVGLINSFCEKDDRIHIIELKRSEHGQLKNFDILLKTVPLRRFDYIMFSDQDDIWYENKVKNTLSIMVKNEKLEQPTLVYTNYNENDRKGSIKKRYANGFQTKISLKRLLIQNWIMGCTIMINKKLARIASDIPKEADNHDNWLVLLALSFGKIYYLDDVTMLHRLHENNVTNNFKKQEWTNKLVGLVQRLKSRQLFLGKKKRLVERLLQIDCAFETDYIIKFAEGLNIKYKIFRVSYFVCHRYFGLNIHKTFEFLFLI